MTNEKRTGKIRYRPHIVKGLFTRETLLVLQVEVTGIVTEYCGGHIDSETVVRWRDARVEDLPVPTDVEAR